MSISEGRRLALISLLNLDRPIEEIKSELANFVWDDAPDLVALSRSHIAAILNRFKKGSIPAATVEQWADSIEMRDDIDLTGDEPLKEAIFILANPAINGQLDKRLVDQILSSISD